MVTKVDAGNIIVYKIVPTEFIVSWGVGGRRDIYKSNSHLNL